MSDPFFARYPDGTVRLRNPNIELMDQDILYHLALGSGSHDLVEMFGDVKVCSMLFSTANLLEFVLKIFFFSFSSKLCVAQLIKTYYDLSSEKKINIHLRQD